MDVIDLITVTKPSLPDINKYVEYLKKIWDSKWITNNGIYSQLLEEKIREHLRVKELVLVCNGTLALQLALRASDLSGEVITTPFTFAATTNSILWEGLKPVFADIDPETLNIDPNEVESKISKDTCAILAVHVFGNPCNVERLKEIADKHNIKLIYDGAHAFNVEFKKQSIFNYGDISTISFHATKVFNTIEGGAIVTNENNFADKLRLMRDHGIKSEEEIIGIGTNAKMNEFQAIMGLCNLKNIDQNIQIRSELYSHYINRLHELKEIKFQKIETSKYNYSYMPILLDSKHQRDLIHDRLLEKGIATRKYFYPLTSSLLFSQPRKIGQTEENHAEIATRISEQILCLPLYDQLTINNVDFICDNINKLMN